MAKIYKETDFKLLLSLTAESGVTWTTSPFVITVYDTLMKPMATVSYKNGAFTGCRVDENNKLVIPINNSGGYHCGKIIVKSEFLLNDEDFSDNVLNDRDIQVVDTELVVLGGDKTRTLAATISANYTSLKAVNVLDFLDESKVMPISHLYCADEDVNGVVVNQLSHQRTIETEDSIVYAFCCNHAFSDDENGCQYHTFYLDYTSGSGLRFLATYEAIGDDYSEVPEFILEAFNDDLRGKIKTLDESKASQTQLNTISTRLGNFTSQTHDNVCKSVEKLEENTIVKVNIANYISWESVKPLMPLDADLYEYIAATSLGTKNYLPHYRTITYEDDCYLAFCVMHTDGKGIEYQVFKLIVEQGGLAKGWQYSTEYDETDVPDWVMQAFGEDLRDRIDSIENGMVNLMDYTSSGSILPMNAKSYYVSSNGSNVSAHIIRAMNSALTPCILAAHTKSNQQTGTSYMAYLLFTLGSTGYEFTAQYTKANVPEWVRAAFDDDLRARVSSVETNKASQSDVNQLITKTGNFQSTSHTALAPSVEALEEKVENVEEEIYTTATETRSFTCGTLYSTGIYRDSKNTKETLKEGENITGSISGNSQLVLFVDGVYKTMSSSINYTATADCEVQIMGAGLPPIPVSYTVTKKVNAWESKADKSEVTTIGSKVGNLDNLQTTDKTSLVNALNEVRSQGGSEQMQADWQQTDATQKDYIRNKPTIPTTDGLETSAHASQTYATKSDVNAKQDTINDLQTIREGAALGATALQEHQSLADYETSEHASQTYQAKGNYLTDAPNDGKQYARKDGTWAEVQGGGGAGIPETEVVTINVKKSDGTAFGGAQIAVIVNGNTTQTLTADGNGVATTTISGGSSYTIAPVEVDNYVANQQIYTACKETRTIEVVYNLVTTELVNVYVRYATEASNAPTLNATQRVILTYIESGTSEEYMLDSSNNVSFRVQRGVLYSIGVTDLSGYTTPKTRVFTASKARRDVRMYYTNMDDGIYLVKADGTQVLTDAETDYSNYEDKENVVAIGIKTAALKAVECCFCISIASDENVRWNDDLSNTTGLNKYSSSDLAISEDLDGKTNTQIIKNAHATCNFNLITDKTLTINGETYNAFVPALGQLNVLRINWSRFQEIFIKMFGQSKKDINGNNHNSSTAHSTSSNNWYWSSSIYTAGTRSKFTNYRCIPFFELY